MVQCVMLKGPHVGTPTVGVEPAQVHCKEFPLKLRGISVKFDPYHSNVIHGETV